MPVILAPDAEAAWLDPDARGRRAARAAGARRPRTLLVAREVYDLVNDVREDGPALIEPREEQTALF